MHRFGFDSAPSHPLAASSQSSRLELVAKETAVGGLGICVNQTDDERYLALKNLSAPSSEPKGSVLTFHDISYEIKAKRTAFKSARRKLLHSVSGIFQPGMNAILGPTGCGKTTLIDILAGRKDKKFLTGKILINGQKFASYKNIAGYVVQDDLIMGTLTVRENLTFSANVRLPSSVTPAEKDENVQRVINELGLVNCSETKIGSEFIRGVSGGERKRTCIGMELIVSPKILFLDEPTTGLDAYTAYSVMSLLQRLSAKGLTIVFSIHQPRYNIFKLFDQLMLLASGMVVYHGPSSHAIDFFLAQDFECEQHNNPPDFFLDVIHGEIAPLVKSINSYNGAQPPAKIASNELLAISSDNPIDVNLVCRLNDYYSKSELFSKINARLENYSNASESASSLSIQFAEYSTSFFVQMKYVSKRTLVNVIRNPSATIAQITVMIFFAIFVGILYFQLNNQYPAGVSNRIGAFFCVVMVVIFGNLSAIELFLKERSLFLHESRSGFYRVSVYFVSKLLCDVIPLRIIPLALFAVVTYFLIGLRLTVINFFCFLLVVLLTTALTAVLTFLIGAAVRLLAVGNVLIGLIYVIMLIFGGNLVNLKSLPSWVSWAQYLSIVRYALNGLCINELKDMVFVKSNGTIVVQNISANYLLEDQGTDYETSWDFWKNVVAMAIATLLLLVACYVQLRCIVRKR